MVGMADGYAQASGRTTVANLHTAPGVGNAMGAIFNAQANHSPLLITAGQQARAQITLQANLTNRDAIRMPHPLVKWSYEPPRAEDVPLALAHGAHLAALPPRGPVFVSLPMDDWYAEVDEADAARRRSRAGSTAAPSPTRRRSRALAERLDGAANPVLVAGPDIDASGAWDAAVALAERQRLPVWATPGDRRRPARLPRGPPQLPRRPAAGDRPGRPDPRGPRPDPRRRQLGLPLLPPHPRAAAARGREAGRDHQRPRRGGAGADGRRDRRRRRAHPGGAARGGARVLAPGAGAEPGPAGNPGRPTRSTPRPSTPPSPRSSPRTRSSSSSRPSSTLALRNQLRLSRPGSYYFSAGGGLGFGLAASVGVQLAQPDRPVVCVLGEGSAQYAITAFWSAVAYKVPVTFLVLRNERVRDPQVVRRRRAGRRARPASTCRSSTSPRSPRATASTRTGAERPRRGPRRARRRRSPPRSRSWSKSRSSRACPSSKADDRAPLAEPAPASEPAADRAPDELAGGRRRSRCAASWRRCSAPTASSRRASDLVRYASDASPYRLLPAGGGDGARRRGRRQGARATAAQRASRSPSAPAAPASTARARATASSSTSAATSAASRSRTTARCARVKPGTVLGHANRVLAPHGRKLGPDPASTDIATVGGVIANNSGGMRCGVDHGLLLDRALADLRPALGDDDRHRRARRRRALRRRRAGAGRRPGGDPRRDPRRRRAERAHPPQVRDQEHDRLPALRLPRRRRAAGDLPPPAGRLRGHARLRRRGGLRDGAAAAARRPPPGSTSPASTRRSRRSATWSTPAPPRSS